MVDATRALPARSFGRTGRLAVVVAAIVLGQAVLYGSSLIGRTVLLPLDVLGQKNYYLPADAGLGNAVPDNFVLSDLVLHAEPNRVFAARELRAGRFPWWNPYEFAGVPHTMTKLSPFALLSEMTESPWVLPWMQMLVALLAGLGAYGFGRRVLDLSFWPAAVVAWTYPLTAFFVLWQGYGKTYSLVWLPWLLGAIDGTVRGCRRLPVVAMAAFTLLTLISGSFDMGVQTLLVAGLYAVSSFFGVHGRRWRSMQAARAGLLLILGFGVGCLCSAPEILTLGHYSRTGARMVRRSEGAVERPPRGIAALARLVLPNVEGSTCEGSVSIAPAGHRNQMESASAGFVGILATLFLVPLAWQSKKHRWAVLFLSGLAVFGLSWCLNLPGFVHLLRLSGLNMMSHNRLVFATSFALLCLAGIALDLVWRGEIRWRRWHWLMMVSAACVLVYCLVAAHLPAFLSARIDTAIRQGRQVGWIRNAAAVADVKDWFRHAYSVGAISAGLVVAAWLALRFSLWRRPWTVVPIGAAMAAELLCFGRGWSTQSSPDLYYPRLSALEQLATSTSGRVVGFDCLPATLAQTHGLRDIRGYDAIDPGRLTSLLLPLAGEQSTPLPYAALQWFTPRLRFEPPAAIRLPPVLDMLSVGAVVFRGSPPPDLRPMFVGNDYWILPNPSALPRAFIPRQVEYEPDSDARLNKLLSPDFDARQIAYVESPIAQAGPAVGSVEILSEIPTRIEISARMQTAGLVVLADLFDEGWQAYVGDRPAPILRTNHAVRGVLVPAGESIVEFRYWPAGLTQGLRWLGLGIAVLIVWFALTSRRRFKRETPP